MELNWKSVTKIITGKFPNICKNKAKQKHTYNPPVRGKFKTIHLIIEYKSTSFQNI